MEIIRKPAVAGMFYPADKNELDTQLNLLFDLAKPEKEFENISGIIAPHAGYIYSGKTAAKAYALLKGKNFKNVVVISPSHREYFRGCSIFPGSYYETPLGKIEINKSLSEKIIENGKNIFFGKEGHRAEHALEVHLPFLQKVLDNFKLTPIVMGDQSPESIFDLAEALAKSIDNTSLIVASSDMSHFYDKETADKLDSRIAERIEAFDYSGLIEDLETKRSEACGGGPIAALMKTMELKGKRNAEIIHRSDSGDVTGDNSEVVGYLSAIIY